MVERLPEVDNSTPDFKCTLSGNPGHTFYIEVKTLDIVHADQRHAEILDEGMLVQDQLEQTGRQRQPHCDGARGGRALPEVR